MSHMDHLGAANAQIRRNIDKGEYRDKVPAPDPAAAPLGTDDEAAGVPDAPPRPNSAFFNDRSLRVNPTTAPDGRTASRPYLPWIMLAASVGVAVIAFFMV